MIKIDPPLAWSTARIRERWPSFCHSRPISALPNVTPPSAIAGTAPKMSVIAAAKPKRRANFAAFQVDFTLHSRQAAGSLAGRRKSRNCNVTYFGCAGLPEI
ncbi:MAG TPA: hypothetical protein VM711_00015 [Sphingomicrobium sp.]|nr:hypothetical protein [Sphingomicrobium sp.]